MMQAMQSQVPQELSALMALQEGMQTGQVAPVTPEGTPTVAGQMAQAATQQMMPPQPDMSSMVQQAGVGAQIQASQQQQAQQQLMQQLMGAQQQQRAAGIETLNPNIRGFKEGGIVGYQDGGVTLGSAPVTGYAPVYEEARRLGINLSPYDSEEERREKLERVARMKEAAKGFGSAQIPGQAPEVAELAAAMNRRPEPTPPSVQVQASDPRAMLERLLRSNIPEAERTMAVRELLRQYPDLLQQQQSGGGENMPPPPPPPVARQEPPAGIAALSRLRPDYTESDRQRELALAARQRAIGRPVSPEQAGELMAQSDAEERKRMIAMGIDPDLLKKEAEAVSRRGAERESYYEGLAKDTMERQRRRELSTYLMGARGSRLGETLSSAANAANRAEEAALLQSRGFMEKKLQVQDLAAKDRMLLEKARYDIARGKFKEAQETLAEREKNRQALERLEAELRGSFSREFGERARSDTDREARVLERTYPTPSETERMLERLRQSGMKMDTPEQIAEALATIKGAGGAGARDIRMQQLANQELDKFMTSVPYLTAKTPQDKATMLENKKRELMQQYPGATFNLPAAGQAVPQGTPKPRFLGFEQPAR